MEVLLKIKGRDFIFSDTFKNTPDFLGQFILGKPSKLLNNILTSEELELPLLLAEEGMYLSEEIFKSYARYAKDYESLKEVVNKGWAKECYVYEQGKGSDEKLILRNVSQKQINELLTYLKQNKIEWDTYY